MDAIQFYEAFEKARPLLEGIGLFLIAMGGGKYVIIKKILDAVIEAIELSKAKDAKQYATVLLSSKGVFDEMDRILESKGYLGKSKNGEANGAEGTEPGPKV